MAASCYIGICPTLMAIAALYDIHGNLPALEAVLEEVRAAGVDRVVIGGDVLPGPMPIQCLDALAALEIPTAFIAGNGEAAVLAECEGRDCGVPARYRPRVQWVATQLKADHVRAIAAWPATLRIGDVLFCHATPRSDTEIFVKTTPASALAPIVEAAGAPMIVCGHTHMQFDRAVGRVRVVNAGSVGMPFGVPGAYWLLLHDGVELRRTGYDLEAAAGRIRATAFPDAGEFADGNVLSPPSEAHMRETFAKVELRASGDTRSTLRDV
jgi:predicted phosphodiesterase